MKSARIRRRKSKFLKNIKLFFIYSFVSLVVLGFFLNTFISNILGYSFAIANSGGIVDIKLDEKYSVVLISSNKIKEVKKVSLITYDKKNNKLTDFDLKTSLELEDGEDKFKIGDILTKNYNSDTVNNVLSQNFGTNLAFTFVTSSDNYELYEKILLGTGSIYDLFQASKLNQISTRDLYLIYSFSGSIDKKDKRNVTLSNTDELDKEIRDIFIDSTLGLESPSITIINATSINGLGKKYTRIVGNLGGRVIDTTSGDSEISESFIIYKNQSPSVAFLGSSLGIKKSYLNTEIGLEYPEIIKSDIVIVLGLDKKD